MTLPTSDAVSEPGCNDQGRIDAGAAAAAEEAALDSCLRHAFAISPQPMLIVAASSGRIVAANSAACAVWGEAGEPIEGRKLHELFGGGELEQMVSKSATMPLWKRIQLPHRAEPSAEVRAHAFGEPGRELVLLEFHAGPATPFSAAGAYVDPLTGLANRHDFDQRLAADLQRVRRGARPYFALLFIDLDEFKPVNDRLGHTVGDRVLAAVARRLAAGIRPGDLLSRRGGDEFTLLVEAVADANEARRIAERLWSRAMEPFEVDGHYLHVGASVGVALGDGSIDSPEAMIEAADRAMYAAKRLGRPVVHCAP